MKHAFKPMDLKRTGWYPPPVKRSAVELSRKVKCKDVAYLFGISDTLLSMWRRAAAEGRLRGVLGESED